MSAVLNNVATIRAMCELDLDQIMPIEQRAYPYYWSRGIFCDCLRVGYYCQVLELDGLIVGYAIMSKGVGESHLLNLCIDPDMQGQGLGRLMLDYLIEAAQRMHSEMLLLEVRPSNMAAIRLYDKAGFNTVGNRNNYYPDGDGREDALILAKTL